MNKYQKVLVISVIVLMTINILLIGFIWMNRPGGKQRGHRGGPRQGMESHVIPRELGFDQQRTVAFRQMFQSHRETMRSLQRNARLKKRQIHLAIVEGDSSNYTMAYSEFRELQDQMEGESTRFISSVAAICDAEQKDRLIQLLNRSLDR